MDFNPYNLPFNYSFSRKASYHYGWDWGPRLVTCGIWKPIKIRAYDKAFIDSTLFRNDKVTVNTTKNARIYGWVDLKIKSPEKYSIQVVDMNGSLVVFSSSISPKPTDT